MNTTPASLLASLAEAIVAHHPTRRVRVGIDGVDGAGKTMLADALAPRVAARGRATVRASVDDFHNPRGLRYARGRHSPDGFYLDSYDYTALRGLLLDPLSPGGSGRYTATYFDHRTDQPVALVTQQAPPPAALIVDGIFLHRPELRDCWDLSIFLKVDFAVSVARSAQRDQAVDTIDPQSPAQQPYVGGQQRYLAECEPEHAADIVIDYNDLNEPKVLKWALSP